MWNYGLWASYMWPTFYFWNVCEERSLCNQRNIEENIILNISIGVVMTITQQGKCQSQSLLCSWSSESLFVLRVDLCAEGHLTFRQSRRWWCGRTAARPVIILLTRRRLVDNDVTAFDTSPQPALLSDLTFTKFSHCSTVVPTILATIDTLE